MSQAFVGTRSVASDELKQLLETLPSSSRCYFLRWVHKVSGFVANLNEFPSPEGQMHTPDFEVRWQQTKQGGYDLLLLHNGQPETTWGFQSMGADWIISDPLDTHLHPKGAPQETNEQRKDTRFPNEFNYPNDLRLQQRYFQNQQTGTIHFVALTLAQSTVKAA